MYSCSMPIIDVNTNLSSKDIKDGFNLRLSKLIAEALNKDEAVS